MIEDHIKNIFAQYIREGNQTTFLDLLEGELEFLDDVKHKETVISGMVEILNSNISTEEKIEKICREYDVSLTFREIRDGKSPYK